MAARDKARESSTRGVAGSSRRPSIWLIYAKNEGVGGEVALDARFCRYQAKEAPRLAGIFETAPCVGMRLAAKHVAGMPFGRGRQFTLSRMRKSVDVCCGI